MTEEIQAPQETAIRKRPASLSFLLFLSFFGSGIGILMALVILIGGPLAGFFNQLPITDAIIRDDSMGNLFYSLLKLAVYGCSLWGLILMWKLRKKGFWFYLIAQLVLLVLPFIFLSGMGSHFLLVRLLINFIFTLFFIILYLLFLKRMH